MLWSDDDNDDDDDDDDDDNDDDDDDDDDDVILSFSLYGVVLHIFHRAKGTALMWNQKQGFKWKTAWEKGSKPARMSLTITCGLMW